MIYGRIGSLLIVLLLNNLLAGAVRAEEVAKPQPNKADSNKTTVSKQAGERLQRIHEESAQAIETRRRALDLHLKAVEEETANELSTLSAANKNGIIDVHYQVKVANVKDAGNAKAKALRDAFEVEKERISASYDRQARELSGTGSKPAANRQVAERLQRIHDECAQAIETRRRGLDVHVKAVEQEMADELSGFSPSNANGIVDVNYESKVAHAKEEGNAKIKALHDAFEIEKKKLTETYDRQATEFEASQQNRTAPHK